MQLTLTFVLSRMSILSMCGTSNMAEPKWEYNISFMFIRLRTANLIACSRNVSVSDTDVVNARKDNNYNNLLLLYLKKKL